MSATIVLDKKVTALAELTFIGRDPTCDIVLEEESVNRYHALIVRRSDDFLLMDFKSVNGTFINGIQVQERSLRDRDSIQIGSRLLVFHQERREPVETGQRGVLVLTALAELVGPILTSGRDQMGYKMGSALFRPVGAQGWWLLAGDSPTLGPDKQGFLEAWSSELGVFHTPSPLALSSADTLQPGAVEMVWFLGFSVRVPPGANLLVLFERAEDPAESLPSQLANLEQHLGDLDRELAGFEPPTVRDLPPPPSGLMQRGTLVARLVMTIGRTLDLYTSTIYRIGRDPAQCDLVVDDDQVSRQHALLIIDTKGQATLLDFKSVNGILVGGKPMLRAHLKEGDRVDIGSQQLRYESVVTPAPARAAHTEEVEPSIGIRVRQADLDAVRSLFASKEGPGEIFSTLLDLVIEQFNTVQIGVVRLPIDSLVCENSSQLEVAFAKDGVSVPAVPLRSGLGARAVEHVVTQRDGFFVRDYNVSQTPRTEPGEPYVLLDGVGSFFMTPVKSDDAGLTVLVGTTRENERLLGRSDWGGIQALVQAAAERLKSRT